MRVQILREDLHRALGMVVRGISSKSQMAILNQVLMESGEDGLVLTGTNLEMGIRVRCGGKVIETGVAAVPGRTVVEFVGSLPTGMVEIESQGETMKISSGGFWATFAGMPPGEYPAVATCGEGEGVKVDKEVFLEIASQVVFAAGMDETRPVLTGVKFDGEDGLLRVCATDGFRLSRKVMKVKEGAALEGLIIPARSISELAKILAEGRKADLTVCFEKGSGQVVFGYDRFEMVTRVLDGSFPDVEKIIPKEKNTEVVINREELLGAIKAVSVFARESNNVVRFSVTDEVLTVRTSGSQTGEGAVKLEAEKKGEDIDVMFNYRYVGEYLQAVKTERVKVVLNGSSVAGVFAPEGDESSVYLVMPVRM